jgi:large subunit ribosomal protein L23
MAFNIFKKNKREKKEVKKPVRDTGAVKAVQSQTALASDPQGLLSHVLKQPHISEKAGILADRNAYVFIISPDANKRQVKVAVEARYKVRVTKVWTSRSPEKKRKVGKHMGIKQGFRKAIVKLAEGHTIEVLPR